MKITFICSSEVLTFPALKYLHDKQMLAAVVFPPLPAEALKQSLKLYGIPSYLVHVVSKQNLVTELKQIITTTLTEAVFVMAFPYKLPVEILNLPKCGCLNFHPGLLPVYKGADPVFWQIKNAEPKGGVVVHRMTEIMDEGPVLLKEETPIIPGETYGLHCQRLAAIIIEITKKLIGLLQFQPLAEGEIQPVYNARFFKKPVKEQLTINWQSQTAAQIESLVNASNPNYGGAVTSIRQMELCILEVAPADINNPPVIKAGTIVHADVVYGVIVACINKEFLKINVVRLKEGYMSGIKLFNLGFKVGELLA